MRIEGARILVLGASGGIGGAVAQALAGAGARVLASGRDAERLHALAHDEPAIETVLADLRADDGVAALVWALAGEPLDAVVNAVGANRFADFAALPPHAIRDVLEASLVAPMLAIHALLPNLLAAAATTRSRSGDSARGERLIVNVGSVFGHIGYAGNVAYSAAKFGLRGFSEALGRELADRGVRVLHVAPRATATAFNDARVRALNRALGQQEDTPAAVARAIVAAMRAGRARTVIGFPERFYAWLNALSPRLIDRALGANLPTIRHHAGTTGDPSCAK